MTSHISQYNVQNSMGCDVNSEGHSNNNTLSLSSFPKRGLLFFRTQAEMFDFAEKENHTFYVSCDKKRQSDNWVKEYLSFKDYVEYFDIMDLIKVEHKNFCELKILLKDLITKCITKYFE